MHVMELHSTTFLWFKVADSHSHVTKTRNRCTVNCSMCYGIYAQDFETHLVSRSSSEVLGVLGQGRFTSSSSSSSLVSVDDARASDTFTRASVSL